MKSNEVIPFEVLASGSKGNATVVSEFLLIDCGVPLRALKQYMKTLKLVLITHIHSDHFKKLTVKNLVSNRPTLRFAAGHFLADALIRAGVDPKNIDILEPDIEYDYGKCKIIPVELSHNVPCYGYKVTFPSGKKLFYATDTNSLNGIRAHNYDVYMIEANYDDEEIKARIDAKRSNGEYAYEYEVMKNHLSRKKCDEFISRNAGSESMIVYMHVHEDTKNDNHNSEDNTD